MIELVKYDRKGVLQPRIATYPRGRSCIHCKWIIEGSLRERAPYCLLYDTETRLGGVVYQSTDKFKYAFHISKTIHDTSENVMFMMQIARTFCYELCKMGIANPRITLNSKYTDFVESKEHQHVWVVCDQTLQDMRKFDELFHTDGGLDRGVIRGKWISNEPYPGDTVIHQQHGNLTKLKDPISFIYKETGSVVRDFYIFASVDCNLIRSYKISFK